ncbi:hypothetical protein ED733_001035 [Metarhizium rileyi]|uniref:2EXR domain-containing protein n=1 Tax=Metarhizium rileyi (strain RCEF 4871) TaxID=1649241 RepID=A0A5C6G3M7_METRR|nr:hypothetical protein ED733_001035 [Metarhizium rileyi]
MTSDSRKPLKIINPAGVGTGSFPQFTKLPPELRSMIWTQSLCYERLIRVELLPAKTPQDLLYEDRPRHPHSTSSPPQGGSFLAVLRNRHEISKLFRVCFESRQSAMRFYRVAVPCYYKQVHRFPVQGTFYFNPELDTLDILGTEYLPRFAHTLWTNDPLHVGLINLGCIWEKMGKYADDLFQPKQGEEDLVRQLLSRLRRVIFGYNGQCGRSIPWCQARKNGWKPQLHRSRPLLASVSKFERLPQDPRPIEAELTKMCMGVADPRDQMYRWFRLLEHWQIEYPHYQVDYRYLVTANNRRVEDREEAFLFLETERKQWEACRKDYEAQGADCEEDDCETASAYGFWLFPIDAFGPIPEADDKITKIGRTFEFRGPRVWEFWKGWDVSKRPPELCLQYLPEVPLSEHKGQPTKAEWTLSSGEETPTKGPARFTSEDDVPQRHYTAGRGSESKETYGLATCIRVAVAGDYDDPDAPGYDRFLAHVDDLEEPVLQGFMALVTTARQEGLSNLRAVMVLPEAGSDANNADGTNDDKICQNEIRALIATVVSSEHIMTSIHNSKVPWYLVIEASKNFDFAKE